MNIIYLLLGLSIVIAVLFLTAFFWANKSGQNDDLYTPSVRMLFDDEPKQPGKEQSDEDHIQT
ncbi:cytochrome oxidase maturation protein, cbb3-type [Pedobacter westerhofensis]|uniref:Cytochrome oxidase maturation protein, cbb3-type n=1 Tax=Pedobacter westerhofensis TaxID=425512 RepID=A0A521EVB2_9SPHI|nr:cbb3-type cytochrome oxidase assembly protein CcoS [Pedobacter westerhofensis]SMO87849.1 cytochrome oxidase maturation protein, cbb3-type [Pedobacter westerhofensis]